MVREGNSRYTYAMFNEILPLAFSFSSMHAKIFPNFTQAIQNSQQQGTI